MNYEIRHKAPSFPIQPLLVSAFHHTAFVMNSRGWGASERGGPFLAALSQGPGADSAQAPGGLTRIFIMLASFSPSFSSPYPPNGAPTHRHPLRVLGFA